MAAKNIAHSSIPLAFKLVEDAKGNTESLFVGLKTSLNFIQLLDFLYSIFPFKT